MSLGLVWEVIVVIYEYSDGKLYSVKLVDLMVCCLYKVDRWVQTVATSILRHILILPLIGRMIEHGTPVCNTWAELVSCAKTFCSPLIQRSTQ